MTWVERCEANYESGQPGSTNAANIRWRMDEDYEGGFSWMNSTWTTQAKAMGYHGRARERAIYATPRQQTMAFRRFKSVGQWPPLRHCL